jgi:hypothetical protein
MNRPPIQRKSSAFSILVIAFKSTQIHLISGRLDDRHESQLISPLLLAGLFLLADP